MVMHSMLQASAPEVGAAATVPKLWLYSLGQCSDVHDSEWCQRGVAAIAGNAGFWAISKAAR